MGALAGGVADVALIGFKVRDLFEDAFAETGLKDIGGNVGAGGQTLIQQAFDPNDLIGPGGFGDRKWVGVTQPLPYTIRFENDPDKASAPAQVVEIVHPLAPTVDPRSFRLSSFGFANLTFEPPPNAASYRDRLDVTDSLGVYVDVTAGIDVLANEAFWSFTSIDPKTGVQPTADPFAGFLPVNDTTGVGEGFARYSVRAAETARTGDRIEARAAIVFDENAPIDTPPVVNTVDADTPESMLRVQAEPVDTTTFHLRWSGTDVGAGIRDYTLYVAKDEDPFEIVEAAIVDTSYLFIGAAGHSYSFFTTASDYVGNTEAVKTRGDDAVDIATEPSSDELIPKRFVLHPNYPNPFNPVTTISFDVPVSSKIELTLYNVLGRRVQVIERADLAAGHYARRVNLSHLASGVYFYEIRARAEGEMLFRQVKKLVLVK